MKRTLPIALMFFILATATTFGQSKDQAKDQDIRTLLNVMGADRLAGQVIDALIPEIRKMAPEVPPSFWRDFRSNVDTKSLVDSLVPIYARYYSDNDVRQLIAFYRSSIGRKVVKVTPAITKDSFAVGKMWGDEITRKLLRKIHDEGYKISQVSKPPHNG